jgi:hypothetical protein
VSYLHYRDFGLEVAKGNVPGHSLVHKFGANESVPNGSWAVISYGATEGPVHPSTASTVRVKDGGNAADTSTGTGAQTVFVNGISTNGTEITEEITLLGTGVSTDTTNKFWRVHRAYVGDCGTYNGTNVGDITIENSTAGVDYLTLASSQGQSLVGQYTIPAGKTGYLRSVELSVDASKPADFRLMKRDNFDDVTTPFSPYRVQQYWDGITDTVSFSDAAGPVSFNEKTDVWVEARGGGAGTEASVEFELILVDN